MKSHKEKYACKYCGKVCIITDIIVYFLSLKFNHNESSTANQSMHHAVRTLHACTRGVSAVDTK